MLVVTAARIGAFGVALFTVIYAGVVDCVGEFSRGWPWVGIAAVTWLALVGARSRIW